MRQVWRKELAFLANILWHVPFLGFISAFVVWVIGIVLLLIGVTAPLGTGLIELGKFLFWPFGNRMISAKKLQGALAINPLWRAWGMVILILWLPIGIMFALALILQGLLLCITIIGLPAGLAILKAVPTTLNPVGKKCVSKIAAEELERLAVQQKVLS